MNSKNIRIAIIDNTSRWHRMKYTSNYRFEVINHGLLCKEIINRYSCNNTIVFKKVFSRETLKCTLDKIENSINWCINNQIKVINLSLGSTSEKDFVKLESVCSLARAKEIIVVAGVSNSGEYTMPANSGFAIGVDVNPEYEDNEYIWNNERQIFEASGVHTLFLAKPYQTDPCSSFAVPTIVAEIANIIKKEKVESFDDIKNILINNAHDRVNKCIKRV